MSTYGWVQDGTLRKQAANLITGGRVLFLFFASAFAVSGRPVLAWAAVPLVLAALVMDWLDGYAARRWGCESQVGGLLDIAGDRIAENVWWVVLAWLHLVPLWVPVVVLSRGFVTDTLRSYALSQGFTAFGARWMMKSRIGYALVASRLSRAAYGVAKAVAFCGLFTWNAARLDAVPAGATAVLAGVALAAMYASVALCVIRGLPVVMAFRHTGEEGRR
ncbi:MAG: CDP-alcohol phosphatidyltransferase family protein [bacterium]|nr:CDP-alcohol phosphatidyltransferase family protein [bacterium]